eukprot:CAMPEP_0185752296 /NCGR_PEP_ID=MMETSP1174-20130828/11108_1 /TAXON_ID=35687 /ORGANISM="Dictyocha speculum, Strain CCMP1381" /LENGTH=179 /DNA_ID=CAMNT_0028429693 /DNA_START=137 /DNA_END=672 /DNA_ORIENTATION=-
MASPLSGRTGMTATWVGHCAGSAITTIAMGCDPVHISRYALLFARYPSLLPCVGAVITMLLTSIWAILFPTSFTSAREKGGFVEGGLSGQKSSSWCSSWCSLGSWWGALSHAYKRPSLSRKATPTRKESGDDDLAVAPLLSCPPASPHRQTEGLGGAVFLDDDVTALTEALTDREVPDR